MTNAELHLAAIAKANFRTPDLQLQAMISMWESQYGKVTFEQQHEPRSNKPATKAVKSLQPDTPRVKGKHSMPRSEQHKMALSRSLKKYQAKRKLAKLQSELSKSEKKPAAQQSLTLIQ